jgi:hypothetical protein
VNLEDLGVWLMEHPRATRGIGLALVAVGTLSYLRMLRTFADLDHVLAVHASETARAASEALGG